MFENKMRCPHCGKCIGVFNSSDEKNSIAKVVKSKPIIEIGQKENAIETKCPRCKEIIYIHIGFKD